MQEHLAKAAQKAADAKKTTEYIQQYKDEIVVLTKEISIRTVYYNHLEKCALKIQKVFRGYIVRSQYDYVSIT